LNNSRRKGGDLKEGRYEVEDCGIISELGSDDIHNELYLLALQEQGGCWRRCLDTSTTWRK
jgi:hypothetical protein